jgi:hypothetical protein
MAEIDNMEVDDELKPLPRGEEIGMLTDFKELIYQLSDLGKYVATIEVAYRLESFRGFKQGIIVFERDLKKFRLRMDRLRILNDKRAFSYKRAVVKVNQQLKDIENEENQERRSDPSQDRD